MKFSLIVPTVVFGMAISIPALAQNDVPASQSMHQAGQEIKQAGSDTAAAAVDTYHGTKRAVKDTAVTAKVKTALHEDKSIGCRYLCPHKGRGRNTPRQGAVTLDGGACGTARDADRGRTERGRSSDGNANGRRGINRQTRSWRCGSGKLWTIS
jgi:hypothetical protein